MEMRWALPDKVFFACGACHILAHVFLKNHPDLKSRALWIRPDLDHTGNHIFVCFGETVFDYHGYSKQTDFLQHYWKKAQCYYPGWGAKTIEIKPKALVTGGKSMDYDGLWLRSPDQFYGDVIARAEGFLSKFPVPYLVEQLQS